MERHSNIILDFYVLLSVFIFKNTRATVYVPQPTNSQSRLSKSLGDILHSTVLKVEVHHVIVSTACME